MANPNRLSFRDESTNDGSGSICGHDPDLESAGALQGLLFGIPATDPATFAAIIGLLVAVSGFASWIPARRATRVDPMLALREKQGRPISTFRRITASAQPDAA